MERTQKEAKEWEQENRCTYHLQLGNSALRVDFDKAGVYLNFEEPDVRSESVIYRRETGNVETCVTTYQVTPQGKLGQEQEGAEPVMILENKDKFFTVQGLAKKDRKLVDIVLGFVQQEF